MTIIATSDDIQSFLQKFADSSETIVWITDIHDICIYISQRNNPTSGIPAPFKISLWETIVHPDDNALFCSLIARAFAAREAYKVKLRVIRSDGTERWVLAVTEPRLGSNGEFAGYHGFILDMSDWNFVFSTSPIDSAHRQVAENSSDLISHHAPETGNYLYVSPSVRATSGHEPAELLGKSVYDFIHPNDVSIVHGEVARQLQGHPSQIVEHRFRSKDGTYIWLSTNVTLLREPRNGTAIGAIVVARDITAECKSREELRRSEERFRSLMNLSSDWYWETDEQGRLTFLSQGQHQLTGSSPNEIVGKTRRERAADLNQPGLQEYESKMAKREPFRDIVYSVYNEAQQAVRHSAITGEPVFEDRIFRGYRGVGRDVTGQIDVANQLEHLAKHDNLTGLPNRTQLQVHLKKMLNSENDGAIAVFFIDLDHFKEVNDSMGHAAGDELLNVVSKRLRENLYEEDLIARFGGDEFVVCSRCPEGPAMADRKAQRLMAALATPITIYGQEVSVHASIGICMSPQDGRSCELLFRNADIAMYQAKSSGRNGYLFFQPEMSAQAKSRLTMETSLRKALDRQEFELYYQPRHDLKTMEVIGMEALIRWNHPELGRLSPLAFIPFAEERGFIENIGKWVLHEACMQTKRLSEIFALDLKVSVNLSARQLTSKNLVAHVRSALKAAVLPAAMLELELTETALVEDIDASAIVFENLKALGLSLAVDDFGTGYSGLAYLGHFPLDVLKLDRSFLSHKFNANKRVITAFVNMAHALGLSVVAEGVEHAEILKFLGTIGCDEAQGYFLAQPLPIEEFEDYLRRTATCLKLVQSA